MNAIANVRASEILMHLFLFIRLANKCIAPRKCLEGPCTFTYIVYIDHCSLNYIDLKITSEPLAYVCVYFPKVDYRLWNYLGPSIGCVFMGEANVVASSGTVLRST